MAKPLPALDEEIDVSEAYRLLLSGTTGIIVTRNRVPIGVITNRPNQPLGDPKGDIGNAIWNQSNPRRPEAISFNRSG
jgi:hypothetical protein